MKKTYMKPFLISEKFTAEEFIAACGDSGKVYKFKCNAGSKWSSYNVYLADGTPYATAGVDTGGCKTDYSSYSPCYDAESGEGYHEAESDSGFLKGYMYKQSIWGANTGSKIDVIIWTDNYTDVHCTTDLTMESWETAKS